MEKDYKFKDRNLYYVGENFSLLNMIFLLFQNKSEDFKWIQCDLKTGAKCRYQKNLCTKDVI